jgi:hypothetical protein
MIKIVPKFTKADITAMVQVKAENIEKAVLLALMRVGEQFVVNARNEGSYKDRTGNLRSSVGYVILKDGNVISDNFRGKAKQGVSQAQKVADDVARKYPRGYVLIGVAGMDYAAAVESRGYDVITSSSTVAETALINAIGRIASKLAK